MKTILISAVVGLTVGVAAGLVNINHQIDDLVVKPVSASELPVKPIGPNTRIYTTYQTQGGNRETIQVTATNNIVPQHATVSIQGDQEDPDTLQPALGYGALGWTMQ
jgi:hypothetical protein